MPEFPNKKLKSIVAAFLLMIVGVGWAQPLYSPGGFLSPEMAFPVTVKWENNQMVVTFDIQPGYALYRSHIAIKEQNHNLPWTAEGTLYNKNEPDALQYQGALQIAVSLKKIPYNAPIRISWQGCSLRGLCYPPQSTTVHRPDS